MVGENVEIETSCKTLEVSRSGYYAWLRRDESKRSQANEELTRQIVKTHQESRESYGAPRITRKFRKQGQKVGKNRVARLMKNAGISGLFSKKFKICTTDSNHMDPIADRVFKTEEQETHPTRPNQIWSSDISYILTDEGTLYLATFIDLYTRKIVGFATDEHMRVELLMNALDMALGRQDVNTSELLAHSDRGSQYASEQYRERLKKLGCTLSMSRKGNCYDNAIAESFFATLKKELIYRKKIKTKDEGKRLIFEYIEVWYNRLRIHSSIGYMSPVQFEESLAA